MGSTTASAFKKIQIPIKRCTVRLVNKHARDLTWKRGSVAISVRGMRLPAQGQPGEQLSVSQYLHGRQQVKYTPNLGHQGSARSRTSSARRPHRPRYPRPRGGHRSRTRSHPHSCALYSHSRRRPSQDLTQPSAPPTAPAPPTGSCPPVLRHRRVKRGIHRYLCRLGWGRNCVRRP